jgi:hypothetical protein
MILFLIGMIIGCLIENLRNRFLVNQKVRDVEMAYEKALQQAKYHEMYRTKVIKDIANMRSGK